MVCLLQRTTIIMELAHESRKSLQLLEAFGQERTSDPARCQADPLHGVILRGRRNAAVLRGLLRAEGGERTHPPSARPATVDANAVIAAEAQLLAFLDRQLLRPDLPGDLRLLFSDHREDVHQATLILSHIRDRHA